MSMKKNVAEFKRKYHLKTINSAILWDVFTQQGYTVVEFNNIQNTADVSTLIEVLQLEDQILHSKCFIYQNDKYKIIFVHEDLSDEERTIVFAHEEGHVWNGHMSVNSAFGNDVIQEYQANEFAHFLLDDTSGKKKEQRSYQSFARSQS